jgi:CRISPR/Cas system-associated endonuclease Cas1
MKRKAVVQIQIGELLAQDAEVEIGEILVSKGTEISEEIIAKLRSNGIEHVFVDSPGEALAHLTPEQQKAVLKKIDARFYQNRNTDSPLLHYLKSYTTEFYAKKLGHS